MDQSSKNCPPQYLEVVMGGDVVDVLQFVEYLGFGISGSYTFRQRECSGVISWKFVNQFPMVEGVCEQAVSHEVKLFGESGGTYFIEFIQRQAQ